MFRSGEEFHPARAQKTRYNGLAWPATDYQVDRPALGASSSRPIHASQQPETGDAEGGRLGNKSGHGAEVVADVVQVVDVDPSVAVRGREKIT